MLILGVPGVGKSTLARHAANACQNTVAIDFADLMLEVAAVGTRRDDLQLIPFDDRRVLFEGAKRRLGQLIGSNSGLVLLEAHFVLRIDGSIVRMGDGLLKVVTPVGVLLVDAPAERIVERRAKDENRHREIETADSIRELQMANYIRLLEVSVGLSINPQLLFNLELEAAMKGVQSIVEKCQIAQ